MPTAMICLASEQVWPNLQGIVYWAHQPQGLASLHIYHTDDENYSKLPAQRLKHFVNAIYPHINTALYGGGSSPRDITTFARNIINSSQPSTHWIINATGGTKLMTAGLLDCVGLERVQVVYREREGHWHILTRSAHGEPVSLLPLHIPLSVTDNLPALALINAQFSAPEGSAWSSSSAQPLPVVQLTESAIKNRWILSQAFADIRAPSSADQGLLFEQYVAALLLAAGVKSLCCNVRLHHQQGDHLEEVDIIANSRGRLVFVECKWASNNAEPVISQLERAAQRRRALGGLNARFLFIRPVRNFSPNHTRLATLIGVKLIDHSSMSSLVDALCDAVGLPLTPDLSTVKSLLSDAHIPTPEQWKTLRPKRHPTKARLKQSHAPRR